MPRQEAASSSERRVTGEAAAWLHSGEGLLHGLPMRRFLPFDSLRASLRSWGADRPGVGQRRRAAVVVVAALLVLLLRPWPPLQGLPGWCVGGLLLWALVEVLLWQWRPRRWR